LIASAISIAGFSEEWTIARQAIRRLAFEPARDSVELTYVWEPRLLDRARSMAFTPQDLVHMHAAQKALAGLLDHYAARARVPLSQILAPLLAPASDQTLSGEPRGTAGSGKLSGGQEPGDAAAGSKRVAACAPRETDPARP
jgi:hypothetical protein